jgi:ATP-dependent Clp protease ATP-binding subunit ClpA
MMFERFTTEARTVVVRAGQERKLLGHPFIGTEHLLLGLLDEGAGIAYTLLRKAGMDRDQVRELIRQRTGAAQFGSADTEALRAIGIDLDAVRARVEESFGKGALQPPQPPGRRRLLRRRGSGQTRGRFTGRAKKVLELSLREAIHLNHRHLGTEHLLLGLAHEGDGLAGELLAEQGLTLKSVRAQVLTELKAA